MTNIMQGCFKKELLLDRNNFGQEISSQTKLNDAKPSIRRALTEITVSTQQQAVGSSVPTSAKTVQVFKDVRKTEKQKQKKKPVQDEIKEPKIGSSTKADNLNISSPLAKYLVPPKYDLRSALLASQAEFAEINRKRDERMEALERQDALIRAQNEERKRKQYKPNTELSEEKAEKFRQYERKWKEYMDHIRLQIEKREQREETIRDWWMEKPMNHETILSDSLSFRVSQLSFSDFVDEIPEVATPQRMGRNSSAIYDTPPSFSLMLSDIDED